MTRFDASAADDRRALFAAMVDAHRERASEFCTLEPDETAPDSDDELVPWIQFGNSTVALDCTDSELDRLKDLLGEYPDFRIDDLESPEEADGTHVRITTHSDDDRLAEFFESVFLQAFGYSAEYRVWAVSI